MEGKFLQGKVAVITGASRLVRTAAAWDDYAYWQGQDRTCLRGRGR